MTRAWATIALTAAVASVALALVGLPSPVLFGALVGGMAYAVFGSRVLTLPVWSCAVGQAIVGVTMGALVDVDTLTALHHDLWPILGACLATLLISIAGGYAFRGGRDMSAATGVFAMIAGGASGVTAIAHELGADDRIVAVVQYLRVLLVLIAMPLVTTVVFRPERDGAAGALGGESALPAGMVFTAICVVAGIALGRFARLPAGALLGPLAVSVLLSVSGWFGPIGGAGVPEVLVNLAYVLIGVQVGLRFTCESLRTIATLLPRAIATIAALIAICAGLGVLLAAWTGVSALDGYLATTPGGLYAVLATAIATGSNVTFVLGTQVTRLLVMLLAAPLLARLLRGRT